MKTLPVLLSVVAASVLPLAADPAAAPKSNIEGLIEVPLPERWQWKQIDRQPVPGMAARRLYVCGSTDAKEYQSMIVLQVLDQATDGEAKLTAISTGTRKGMVDAAQRMGGHFKSSDVTKVAKPFDPTCTFGGKVVENGNPEIDRRVYVFSQAGKTFFFTITAKEGTLDDLVKAVESITPVQKAAAPAP